MLSCVQGLAPICAPVLGGLLLMVTDRQGIFLTLPGIGILLLFFTTYFHESLSIRSQGKMKDTFKAYLPVLRNHRFMRYVLIQAMAMGVMFAYIAASPFIFQEHYGLSPFMYSLCFGINALGIMGRSLFIIRFRQVETALQTDVRGFLLLSIVVVVTLTCNFSVYYVETALFILLVFLGMILPTSTTLALEPVRESSGSASAILGFLTFFVGGIYSPLAGLGNMLISTSILIVFCALCTLLLTRRKKQKYGISIQINRNLSEQSGKSM